MIVVHSSHPHVRAALVRAAHFEEDVILEPELVRAALDFGHPRLLVSTSDGSGRAVDLMASRPLPILNLSRATLSRWDAERRATDLPVSRVADLVERLSGLVEMHATRVPWVDRMLADLSRAAGSTLPPALRAFGRRVLEFPTHYHDLHPMSGTCRLSRGALKARFRRRDMESPYSYLRWFRILACARVLSDRSVTVAEAARRLGFTSDGNLCRTMRTLTGWTPTTVRTEGGRKQLLLSFARDYLRPQDLEGWKDLRDIFPKVA